MRGQACRNSLGWPDGATSCRGIHEINERITNGVVIKKIGVVINGVGIVINGIGFVIRFIIASRWSGVQHGRHRA